MNYKCSAWHFVTRKDKIREKLKHVTFIVFVFGYTHVLIFSVAIATIRTRFFHVDILKSMWIYYYIVIVYPHSF